MADGSTVNVSLPLTSSADIVPQSDDTISADLAPQRVSKRIVFALTLVGMVPSLLYASFLPHLFFYLRLLDQRNDEPPESSNVFLGYIVAAFSLTKMAVSPGVAWMGEIIGLRTSLVMLMLCLVGAAAGFAMARDRYVLFGAYVLMGLAGANSTLCRVYVPRIASTQFQRTELLACLTTGTTTGFVLGPALGSLLALVGCSAESDWSSLAFNGCTAPGWVGVAYCPLAVGLIGLLPRVERRRQQQPSTAKPLSPADTTGSRSSIVGVLTIASQQLAIVLPFAAIESLTAPICAAAYDWTPKKVGVLFSVASICTLPCSFLLKPMMTRCGASPRVILLVSMFGQVLALCCLDDSRQPLKGNQVPVVQFVIGLCAFYVFYVIAQTTVFVVFYSLFAHSPTCGIWVGWISSSGSLGRWIWPIVSVNLFSVGAGAVWLSTAFTVALLGPGLLLLNWRRLTPAREPSHGCQPSTQDQAFGSSLDCQSAQASFLVRVSSDIYDLDPIRPSSGTSFRAPWRH